MKAHIGADADSGLVHTVVTKPANTADVAVVDEMLHGQERVVYGDSGYMGGHRQVRRQGAFAGRSPPDPFSSRPSTTQGSGISSGPSGIARPASGRRWSIRSR